MEELRQEIELLKCRLSNIENRFLTPPSMDCIAKPQTLRVIPQIKKEEEDYLDNVANFDYIQSN